MSQGDFKTLMSILNENLTEGQGPPAASVQSDQAAKSQTIVSSSTTVTETTPELAKPAGEK